MPGYSGDLKMNGGKKNPSNSKKNGSKQPKIHQGPRGGKYIIKNGNKQYLKS